MSSDLASVQISLAHGGARNFFYRAHSAADKGVIQQVFGQQDYNLAGFPLSTSLKRYGDAAVAAGRFLLVLDLGANIGASPLYLADIDPKIHVCAVEPEHSNFEILKMNCAGLPITALEAAVASQSGQLWLSDPGLGEWGFRVGPDGGKYQVAAITIDEILSRFEPASFTPLICKIDIEGGESDLFRSNDDWIDRFPLTIIELHDFMFPGTGNSRNFLRSICKRNIDVMQRGENLFFFNNDLLVQIR
jgi:FkbM family methyltransferase